MRCQPHFSEVHVAAQKLAGMTGTAATEAAEFSNIYKLEVTEVPPNRTIDRTDNPDVVFRTEAGPCLVPNNLALVGDHGVKRNKHFLAGAGVWGCRRS